jgi:hypothetical protein
MVQSGLTRPLLRSGPLSSPAAERGVGKSYKSRHCEEERRGNPRYAESLCK